MKKALYIIAAVSLAATSAMASKARQAALSNTTAITDIQSIFLNPADVNYVGEFATFEMGETATNGSPIVNGSPASSPDAEGGFLRTMGDAKVGFYLGKTSSNVTALRSLANTAAGTTYLSQENPFEVFYGAKAGDQNWGLSFSYSNSDKKLTSASTDDAKQTAMGLRLGVKNDVWGAYANIGLGSTAQTGTSKYTGKSGLTVGGHYFMGTIKVIVKQDMSGAKANDGTNDVFDYDFSETTIGFTNAWKSEGSMAFYGLAYKSKSEKYKETGALANTTVDGVNPVAVADGYKYDTTSMPFTIGAEVLATSWLKLRGSVTQNLMMGSKKDSPNETNSIAHNTKAAAGAGFVWGKNNLDMVLTAMGTAGTLDTSAFGTAASYTYMF